MKPLLVLAAALLGACTEVPIKAGTGSIDWLAGCWRMERSNGHYEEVWLAPTRDGTLGVSREVRDGKTVMYEHLRIELRPGNVIAYVAWPSGQAQAAFLAQGQRPAASCSRIRRTTSRSASSTAWSIPMRSPRRSRAPARTARRKRSITRCSGSSARNRIPPL